MTSDVVNQDTHDGVGTHSIGLTTALLIITAISLILVGFSYFLYTNNSRYKYDLARPDVKSVGGKLTGAQIDDKTTPVDKATITQTQELIDTYVETLDSLNSFNEKPVNNESMGLKQNITPSL